MDDNIIAQPSWQFQEPEIKIKAAGSGTTTPTASLIANSDAAIRKIIKTIEIFQAAKDQTSGDFFFSQILLTALGLGNDRRFWQIFQKPIGLLAQKSFGRFQANKKRPGQD